MKFHHNRWNDGGLTLHTFGAVVAHDSALLEEFDAFVERHGMEHERVRGVTGMFLEATTDNPALATLFKLTF